MAIAHPDGEADAAIKFRRRIEIADGMHDVVQTMWHS
jgi:hypothetical protein